MLTPLQVAIVVGANGEYKFSWNKECIRVQTNIMVYLAQFSLNINLL